MERDKLKSLLQQLKTLVNEIESEVYSDVDAYKTEDSNYSAIPLLDYDEIYNDDDGYCD